MTHHKFHLATLARKLAVLVKQSPIDDAELRNQSKRAAMSVACNVAESCGYDGAAKQRFFKIARGSAFEVAIAYEIALETGDIRDAAEILGLVRQVVAITTKLIRR